MLPAPVVGMWSVEAGVIAGLCWMMFQVSWGSKMQLGVGIMGSVFPPMPGSWAGRRALKGWAQWGLCTAVSPCGHALSWGSSQ